MKKQRLAPVVYNPPTDHAILIAAGNAARRQLIILGSGIHEAYIGQQTVLEDGGWALCQPGGGLVTLEYDEDEPLITGEVFALGLGARAFVTVVEVLEIG